jgi:phospholipid/cholesterol/gamma-HCH transport system ATP-binding protein
MPALQPVLDLNAARAVDSLDAFAAPAVTLRLMPGDLALVEARNGAVAAWFADLCCGLIPLSEGAVRFLGRDWQAMPPDYAAALRGRVGRVFADGAWVGFLDMATNILLPSLHHSREARDELRAQATKLACAFGLPGLPLEQPRDLAPIDLARAACVRAFLGEPALLLLERPLQDQFEQLITPLLEALASARQRGAAAIWLTRGDLVWNDHSVPANHRMRLRERGLVSIPTRLSA